MIVLIYDIRVGRENPHMPQLMNTGLPQPFSKWTQGMMRETATGLGIGSDIRRES